MMLHVYRDQLVESNCYIFSEDKKALIIDPNSFEEIDRILKEQDVTPEWVILTHEHCDHMAGLEDLRRKYPVKVLATKACSKGIQNTRENMSAMMEVYLHFRGIEKVSYEAFSCKEADVTFDGEYSLDWQGHEFRLCAVQGHTKGSCCIWWNGTNLFSGDYLIPGEPIITRLPGGDEEGYEKVGKAWLKALPEGIRIYPGHGEDYILTSEGKAGYGL